MTNISYNYHLFFLSIFLVHTIKSQQNQVYLATADKKIIVTQKNDLHVSKLLQTLLQDCNPTIAPCIPVNQHPFYTKKYLTKMLYDMHKYKPMVRSDKKITKKLLFSGYLKKLDYLDATKNERTDFIHDFKLLVTCISLQLEQKHRDSLQDYLRYDCVMNFKDYKKLIQIKKNIPMDCLKDLILSFKGIIKDKKKHTLKTGPFILPTNYTRELNKSSLIALFYCLKNRLSFSFSYESCRSICYFCRLHEDYLKVLKKLPLDLQQKVSRYRPLV